MTYYITIPPPTHLSKYVRFYWVLESEASKEKPYIHRSMADGCTELLFHYKGVFEEIKKIHCKPSFISGIHSHTIEYRTFRIHQNFGIFGVYLYPYALPRIFRHSATEFTNLMPDIESVLGKEGKNLEEKMVLALNNQERYMTISNYITNKININRRSIHPAEEAVYHVVNSQESSKISRLSNQYNLSERQFERKFKEFSGFPPKTYMRIARFSKACNFYGEKNKNLTDIAFQCGYYDQSHFIKDFKTFSGYHPSTYFSGEAPGIEWRQ